MKNEQNVQQQKLSGLKVYTDKKTVFINGKAEKSGNEYLVIEIATINSEKPIKRIFAKESAKYMFEAFKNIKENAVKKVIAMKDFIITKNQRKEFNPETLQKEEIGETYYVVKNIKDLSFTVFESELIPFLNQLVKYM